jgi:L-ascorbate 6-phosphate lactonase
MVIGEQSKMKDNPRISEINSITYLGQAGFLIEIDRLTIMIDPYLTNYVVTGGFGDASSFHREFEPPLSPEDLPVVDYFFITHAHADHCDLLTLAIVLKRNPECVVICPEPVLSQLRKMQSTPVNTLVPVTGEVYREKQLEFIAVPAAHYGLDQNPQGTAYFYFGYILKIRDLQIYHSGDTILYPGLVELLKQISPRYDIACLPVNGRDAERERAGITGNLTATEALFLANEIQTRALIPMHNDLFKINQANPSLVEKAFSVNQTDLKILNLHPGERYLLQ